jgi:hypothetical protein
MLFNPVLIFEGQIFFKPGTAEIADIPRAGRFLNFWRRDFMSQYIAEIAANLDKFARSPQ